MSVPTWKETASRDSVTVQTTPTVIYGPHSAEQYDVEAYVEVINDDATSTLTLNVELATATAGPWKVTPHEGLWAIAPGDSAHTKFDARALPFWRIRGTADAGNADARVTVRILRRGT